MKLSQTFQKNGLTSAGQLSYSTLADQSYQVILVDQTAGLKLIGQLISDEYLDKVDSTKLSA